MNRVVVVLPLVPVTATIGMRPLWPSANIVSMIASPTGRGLPLDGSMCIRKPGLALTSMIMPPCSSSGRPMSSAHHVDAGNVQTDDLRGFDGSGGHVRMHQVGHVGGGAAGAEVRVAADEHVGAGRRHRIGREPLFGQHGQGNRVEPDLAQRRGMIVAATGILVHARRPARPPCARRRPRPGPARGGPRRSSGRR